MVIPQAVYERLRGVARAQGTASYTEIAQLAGIDTDNPHFGALVGRLLDDVNRAEQAAGRPLLSAVVIGKDSNLPGAGFFECARDLRLYSGNDDLAYWMQELKRVHDYWSST